MAGESCGIQVLGPRQQLAPGIKSLVSAFVCTYRKEGQERDVIPHKGRRQERRDVIVQKGGRCDCT